MACAWHAGALAVFSRVLCEAVSSDVSRAACEDFPLLFSNIGRLFSMFSRNESPRLPPPPLGYTRPARGCARGRKAVGALPGRHGPADAHRGCPG